MIFSCDYKVSYVLKIPSERAAEFHFTREMDQMCRGAELEITPQIRQKLERHRAKCGSGVERS